MRALQAQGPPVARRVPREPYRRVLVAVDFSPACREALGMALRAAPQAHWVLLALLHAPFEGKLRYAGVDAATVARYRQQARLQAAQRLGVFADAAGLAPGTWEPCIVEGDAPRRVVESVRWHGCDLVVLGQRGGRLGWGSPFDGVARHVLAEAGADLLVAPAPAPRRRSAAPG